MVPINGKPVISWIMEDLVLKQFTDVVIVMRKEDDHLYKFVSRSYKGKFNLKIVQLEESNSILESLQAGMAVCDADLPIHINLGDTLVRDEVDAAQDMLFVHEVIDSSRWCIAVLGKDDYIESFIEKQLHAPLPHLAVCGFYKFHDTKLLKDSLDKAISNGGKQLSDMLSIYLQKRKLLAIRCNRWFDFGNIDNLIAAKQKLLQSRYFNQLTIDPILNTITKVSEFDEKLRNELNWYEELPDRLKVLSPRIISKKQYDGKLHLVQEYYGYPNLAELFLYADLNTDNWSSIFRKLFDLHNEFRKYTSEYNKDKYEAIYIGKTISRLETLQQENEYWNKVFAEPQVIINGVGYKNFYQLEDEIRQYVENLLEEGESTIIHGDFCFSNILFDINSQIAKLIDPRGSFGDVGIYGDPRYDMAKLRHSACGLYDFIISDLYDVEYNGNTINYKLYVSDNTYEVGALFDEMLMSRYSLDCIKFFEALLFLSMLPLHKDKPNRQVIMYATGIKYLNELFTKSTNVRSFVTNSENIKYR
jgi:dTDP-glucose pyrophosphorylase